jgi:glycogen operon protein
MVIVTEEADAAPRRRTSTVTPEILDRLAAAAGIADEWWDMTGERHVVGADTKRALLSAMGLHAGSTCEARARLSAIAGLRERRALPHVVVADEGSKAEVAITPANAQLRHRTALRLKQEDGTERVLPFAIDDLPARAVTAADGRKVVQRTLTLPRLPAGYHSLHFDGDPELRCRIVVAPDRCFLPPEILQGARRFGLAAHLYAIRRYGDHGIGDFTTLAAMGAATASVGGSIVGINPLHALFAEDRERASPYHPCDRRSVDPIYIDVDHVPDLAASDDARGLLARNRDRIAALSMAASVDYTAVWQVKRAVLEACFKRFEQRGDGDLLISEFDRFVSAGGLPLRQFALFEAIAAEHPRAPWYEWPHALREPNGPGIADFARRNAHRVRFALYLQWLADRQFGAAAHAARASGLALGFFRDLAVGAAPDGAEVWANPSAFAHGVTIGAPPDPFSTAGQNWNLPPQNPLTLTSSGFTGFGDLLAANMRHAGALRIDHVMGLSRLYWIPEGATAAEGAYVQYPLEALLGVLAIESLRARCIVVGEDLGTVPQGLRERLAAADVLSYRVLWFERDNSGFAAPSRYPAKSVACVSTHDLPTIAGWWSGADIAEKSSLGMLDADASAAAEAERLDARHALAKAIEAAGVSEGMSIDARAPHDAAITSAIHRYMCATSAAVVLIQADDLAGETTALNLPGTDRHRPNWRRKVRVDVEALWRATSGSQAVADFARARPRR